MQPAKSHLSVVPGRTSQTGLRSLRSWLGKQAAIGGRPYVERIVKSDEFARRFLETLGGETRMQALASVTAILAKAPAKPVPYKPDRWDSRIKIKWTDDMKSRFLREAPRSKNDLDLCRRLGLPSSCRGAMRARRSSLGILRAPATVKMVGRLGAPPVVSLPLAA